MIYVDKLFSCIKNANWPYLKACHLIADDIDELHMFAEEIGLKKSWFQNHSRLPHYDLTATMRKRAVTRGAVEVDRIKLLELMRK